MKMWKINLLCFLFWFITIHMRQERNNKQFYSNARKHNERKYIRIRMYVSMNELESSKVNSVEIKSICFMKTVTLSLVFQQVSKKWVWHLYKYLSAVRGYHYYRKYGQSVAEQELDCMHKRDNLFYFFCYKINQERSRKNRSTLAYGNFESHKVSIGPWTKVYHRCASPSCFHH